MKNVILVVAAIFLTGCATPALRNRVRDLEMENAALREANAELRKQVESCRNTAGRIDGYWRKAQDEAIFEKASREAAKETNKKLQFQINALLAK